MSENSCICCGDIVPEGRQVCWSCEHMIEKASKPPSEKQIELVNDITNTLNIDFPQSSMDFTEQTYRKFINDHIEKAKGYWKEDNNIKMKRG